MNQMDIIWLNFFKYMDGTKPSLDVRIKNIISIKDREFSSMGPTQKNIIIMLLQKQVIWEILAKE